ncbi:universal stress protein [Trueperella pyogenes]|uniref:universal stress protein n=1 Tax=Trueperella pyogenes TaxID=1661 RepID=UPI000C1B7C4F|nr:universal stress protein [Trueperella pyogenes]MDF2419986.1 universal stress protein [Trueperella pyogenes]
MPIVVPVNQGIDEALTSAIELAQRQDHKLIALLHRPLHECDQDFVDQEIDALTDQLDAADIAFSIEVRVGEKDLATHISELVTKEKADLVVVSLARKPVNGKLLLGSQIQKLLVECPCSVLVVREKVNV